MPPPPPRNLAQRFNETRVFSFVWLSGLRGGSSPSAGPHTADIHRPGSCRPSLAWDRHRANGPGTLPFSNLGTNLVSNDWPCKKRETPSRGFRLVSLQNHTKRGSLRHPRIQDENLRRRIQVIQGTTIRIGSIRLLFQANSMLSRLGCSSKP